MAVPQYKITFDGQLLPGIDQPTAVRNLAILFEASEEAVERLFEGRKLALKRHLLLEDTHKFVPMLEQAGIQTQLEDDTPFDAAGAETLAGGATYDDVPYSPWTTPQSSEQHHTPVVTSERKFYSLEGRLGRINYAAWLMLLGVAMLAATMTFLPALERTLGATFTGFIIGACYLAASIVIGVRRLHDMNWSGWLMLLAAIPYLGMLFSLLLLFMPGTVGANRFGPQPPPAGTPMKVVVGIAAACCVIAVAGLIWFVNNYRG